MTTPKLARDCWVKVAALAVALLFLGCLPGKRDNTPFNLDATAKTDAKASELPDGATASDAPAGDGAVVDTKADGAVDATNETIDAAMDATAAEIGPVSLGGCTTDTQCNQLPFGACNVGACDLVTGLCKSKGAPDGTACSVDACTEKATCQSGSCTGTAVKCEDKGSCVLAKCDLDLGCLYQSLDGVICDDKNPCTKSEFCVKGACVGKPIDCNDNDVCTSDNCDSNGNCQHGGWSKDTKTVVCTPSIVLPKDLCNDPGVCDQKVCVTTFKCEDNNPCSNDLCLNGKCDHLAIVGACPGGNADPCVTSVCQQSVNGVDMPTCVTKTKCEDKVCNTVTCSPSTGSCIATKLESGPCDDGDPCTASTSCIKGQCKGTAVVCNDGNPCTTEACTATVGCVATPVADGANACDDGSGCTTADKCKGGKCAGTAVNCDDGNSCTKDLCDPVKGCDHVNVTDGGVCSAGTCKGGQCTK